MPDTGRPQKAGIHQPNFLPYPGFFHKMMSTDLFIFLDTAPYTKNGFQNRNRIMTANGPIWLTVPVLLKGKSGDQTRQIQINGQVPWKKKHLKTIRLNYSRTPCFKQIFPRLETVYDYDGTNLTEFNLRGIRMVTDLLEIRTPFTLASSLPEKGEATDRIISLLKATGSQGYLSGKSGRNYLDQSAFEKAGIRLEYQQFHLKNYQQNHPEPILNLSIIDMLFFLGSRTRDWILGGGE